MEPRRSYLLSEEFVKVVEEIPNLKCYTNQVFSRKPLESEKFQLLCKIAYYGALRINEAIPIKVKDIDPVGYNLKLPETKTGYVWCKCAITETINKRKKLS